MAVLERIASSGTEWQAVHILCELARRGIVVDVVSLQAPPPKADPTPLRDALNKAGVEQFELGLGHRWNLAEGACKLAKLARDRKTDIIHGRLYFAGIHVAATSSLLPRTRRVVSFHNVIYDYPNQGSLDYLRRYIEATILKMGIHAFAAVSTSAAESYQRNLHLRGVEVIPNAVPVDTITPLSIDRKPLALQFGLRAEVPWVLMPARLVFEKGHTYLIQAAKTLRMWGLDFQIICAGYGPLLDQLRRQVVADSVQSQVCILGYEVPRSDLMHLMDASEIVVLPSLFEGFPNTAAEAMAKAKPILGTTIGGFRDLVTSENHGLLVPPRDATAIAKALERLLGNKEFRSTLGTAGRERVKDHFGVLSIADRWENFYLRTLGRS